MESMDSSEAIPVAEGWREVAIFVIPPPPPLRPTSISQRIAPCPVEQVFEEQKEVQVGESATESKV